METVFYLILGIESLDDAQTSESLLDIAHQHAPLLLTLQRLALQTFAHLTHNHPGYRKQHKHKQRELP
jgi:hypothetical protein